MRIEKGNSRSEYGRGVNIHLSGDEVAMAIIAYLMAHGVHVEGPRTVTVNGDLCESGRVYVDPSGFCIDGDGKKWDGREKVKTGEAIQLLHNHDIEMKSEILQELLNESPTRRAVRDMLSESLAEYNRIIDLARSEQRPDVREAYLKMACMKYQQIIDIDMVLIKDLLG